MSELSPGTTKRQRNPPSASWVMQPWRSLSGPSSQVQPESPEVAGGVLSMHHGGGGDGHEYLVASAQLEQTSLVDGVQGVFGVRRPALGAYTLQQLNGSQVRRFLVDALNQLVAGALLLALAGGRVAEVDLRIQVVAAILRHAETPVGQCHVVQVGAEALVGPGAHRVAA